MVDIGDITGPIALFITLLWWFGLTPKKVAYWVKQHQLLSNIGNVILPTLFAAVALYFAIFRFVAGPITVGGNKWILGGFWILVSLYFITRTEQRHIRRFVTFLTKGILPEILGSIFLVVSMPLLFMGLNLPLKLVLVTIACAFGGTVIIVGTIVLIVRRLKRKTAE